MEQQDLSTLLTQRGIQNRVRKDEVEVKTCSYCGNDRWNLELNLERGVYHCWACRSSGTVRGFLNEVCNITTHVPVHMDEDDSRFGSYSEQFADYKDVEAVPVLEGPEGALRFLERRRLVADDYFRFDIRYTSTPGRLQNRILFPVREYFSQSLFGFMGRRWRSKDGPPWMASFSTPLIHGYRLHASRIHVLVEGLFDAVQVYKTGLCNAACMLGTSKLNIVEQWACRVGKDELIVLLLDGDAMEKAEKLMWKLKPVHENTKMFALPQHLDPGDLEPSALARVVHTISQKEA